MTGLALCRQHSSASDLDLYANLPPCNTGAPQMTIALARRRNSCRVKPTSDIFVLPSDGSRTPLHSDGKSSCTAISKLKVQLLKTTSNRQHVALHTSFRFMDLPSELRLNVYEYYLQGKTVINFTEDSFVPPALARSTGLVRQEILPVWEKAAEEDDHYNLSDSLEITSLRACVVDVSFDTLMEYLEDVTGQKRTRLLYSTKKTLFDISIVMVFTKRYSRNSQTLTTLAEEWRDWLRTLENVDSRKSWFDVLEKEDIKIKARFDWTHISAEDA